MNNLPNAAVKTLLLSCLVLGATSVTAQIPDKFTNLQVLDTGIQKSELKATMKGFSLGLGVRCTYCHVESGDGSLGNTDFASDEKQTKMTARKMLKMTAAINQTYISTVAGDHDDTVQVRCVTCHRGQPRPILIQDVLHEALAAGGVDSAKTAYLALREEYYGSHTYDFSERALFTFASDLSQSGQIEQAKSLLEMDLELNPESSGAWLQLAIIESEQGNKEEALKKIDRALELNPQNRRAMWLKQQLSSGN